MLPSPGCGPSVGDESVGGEESFDDVTSLPESAVPPSLFVVPLPHAASKAKRKMRFMAESLP
jgi:hypothetical protein